jgi:hypothetical protein
MEHHRERHRKYKDKQVAFKSRGNSAKDFSDLRKDNVIKSEAKIPLQTLADSDDKPRIDQFNKGTVVPLHSPGVQSSFSRITSVASSSSWNFEADYNDHFETPKVAYQDLLPVLDVIVNDYFHKARQDTVIYDPYYCQGNMIQYLNELSFSNVINVNEDFYLKIKRKSIPGFVSG